uniref:Putative secreted protein n=1 Tax=Anopheles darlingi TaxID=43151 RepID=A0A2M4DCH7_ANODA
MIRCVCLLLVSSRTLLFVVVFYPSGGNSWLKWFASLLCFDSAGHVMRTLWKRAFLDAKKKDRDKESKLN